MHDDTKHEWKLGDVVRYGAKPMDIMQIEGFATDEHGVEQATGVHIQIGSRTAPVRELKPLVGDEQMFWDSGEDFRQKAAKAGLKPGQTWRDLDPNYEPSPQAHLPRGARAGG